MADSPKTTRYKDARTVRELLTHLRADADLLASEIILQQIQFGIIFMGNLGLIAVTMLKSIAGFEVMQGFILSGFIPLLMITVVGGQSFFWFNKKTYATIERDYGSAGVEDALESLLTVQLARQQFLMNHRDSIRISSAILAFNLFFTGLLVGWMALVTDSQPKLPTY